MAFIFTDGKKHYRTHDRGVSWQEFSTSLPPSFSTGVLAFNAHREEYIIYHGLACKGSTWGWGQACHTEAFYTENSFQAEPKSFLTHVSRCIWARNTKDLDEPPVQQIFCIASDSRTDMVNPPLSDLRLATSQNFFVTKAWIDFGVGRDIFGVVGIGGAMKFLIAAVKEPSSAGMSLYITENGQKWARAQFPHDSNLKDENAYTILESTDYTVLVDVLARSTDASSTLYRSNSNGTFFTKSLEHVNRNANGIVDYEKIELIEGTMIANVIDNWMDADNNNGITKYLKSKISLDDGATWKWLLPPEKDVDGKDFECDIKDKDKCSLHLYGVTSTHNYGRVFSSPAPGIVMGVGNVGEHLLPYDKCDTFLSTDGGLTWKMVHKDAHKYEFGNQGSYVVIINDEEPVDHFRYSTDRGATWKDQSLGIKVRARMLTTVQDSTSQKFMLLGSTGRQRGDGEMAHYIFELDFGKLNKRACKRNDEDLSNGDFEKWYARRYPGEGPDCLMGHQQYFIRRKQDADCYIDEKFKDPSAIDKNCDCADEDYECDYNFALDSEGICKAIGPEIIPKGECKHEDDEFEGSSGYRLIPGNTCNTDNGIQKDKPVKKKCSDARPKTGDPQASIHLFEDTLAGYFYFDASNVVLMRTKDGDVFRSRDQGEYWSKVYEGERFVSIIQHPYDHGYAYLITADAKAYYTKDQGQTWDELNIPMKPNSFGYPPIDMHPKHPDWLIWLGSTGCDSIFAQDCHTTAYYTKNNGQDWVEIDTYTRLCSWARDTRFETNDELIYCQSYRNKHGSQLNFHSDNPQQLLASRDFFQSDRRTLFENVLGFATFEEYMVVAEINSEAQGLKMWTSVDGQTFAEAQFPHGVEIGNHAYTVLESVTDSIFLHVTTNEANGNYWGTLFISNSNGTYYSVSEDYVNRDMLGFVDFEKMHGVDGIAIVNSVTNPDAAKLGGKKKLRTKLTWNNGAHWDYLHAPNENVDGLAFGCDTKKIEECSLNLHHYTERLDPRDTFGSTSAIGLMIGVGNVGSELGRIEDSDTFLTRDAGRTWRHVKAGSHLWEFGDQGSIIVLVKDNVEVDSVSYTLDEGATWETYPFATDGDRYVIVDIATAPMDNSRRFIMYGHPAGQSSHMVAIFLDFSALENRQCVLDKENSNESDFELWAPQRGDDHCLFGRKTEFYRRIPDRKCYIGVKLPEGQTKVSNCECTEYDFECNYNHVRGEDGVCRLVEGASMPTVESDEVCKNDAAGYYDMTAYRRLPYSSCKGGAEKDIGTWRTCPGKGYSAGAWAAFVLIPLACAGAVAAILWNRRKRGGMQFGRIRLPDFDSMANSRSSRNDLISTVAAVVLFVPVAIYTVGANVFDRVSGYISKRRGGGNQFSYVDRGGYTQVSTDDDAAEVLMDDYDDEEE